MAKRKGSERKKRETEFGIYLTQLRLRLGKTQQEIAESIEVDKSCICRMETGERAQRSPRGIKLSDIAAAYEVSIQEIQAKASWPQMLLPLDVTVEEMQELLHHLEQIRINRQQKKKD